MFSILSPFSAPSLGPKLNYRRGTTHTGGGVGRNGILVPNVLRLWCMVLMLLATLGIYIVFNSLHEPNELTFTVDKMTSPQEENHKKAYHQHQQQKKENEMKNILDLDSKGDVGNVLLSSSSLVGETSRNKKAKHEIKVLDHDEKSNRGTRIRRGGVIRHESNSENIAKDSHKNIREKAVANDVKEVNHVSKLTLELDIASITKPYDKTDFVELARRLRLFKKAYNHQIINTNQNDDDQRTSAHVETFLHAAETSLFPWLNISLQDMTSSFHGRGIVICMAGKHMKLARSLIGMIRKLDCNLPIEIFYIDGELDKNDRAILNELPNVELRDITKVFNNNILQLESWAIKPFSILAASFSEVILMDADDAFAQSPEVLFHAQGYKDTGTIFYRDRSFEASSGYDKSQWSSSLFQKPLRKEILETRLYRGKTGHEQESGVVVIDKGRRLMGLLTTCKMNEKEERDKVTYKKTLGDKESFWIGFEMINEPFHFSPHRAGIIGSPRHARGYGKVEICAMQILHLDESGELPLWWNNALIANKNTEKGKNTLPSFEKYFLETDDKEWIYRGENVGFCLTSEDASHVHDVSAEMKRLLKHFQDDWNKL